MNRVFRNRKGLTLIELIVASFLIGVVFLALSALFVASQNFFFTANDRVIISYELQYAAQHIYRNIIRGLGDETSPPGSRALEVPNPETLYITINTNDPLTRSNYASTLTYIYSKSGDELLFNNGISSESMAPKITVTGVNFALNGNLLTMSFTGTYKNQSLTFYSAGYPRLASFQ